MGSALLNCPPEAAPAPPAADALRLQVVQRLADHRTRRQAVADEPKPAVQPVRLPDRSARIAAAVAERYAKSPSYRAVLAAHAERAIQEAQAAAETAARNARAVVQAQEQLLADLEAEARAAQLVEASQPLLDESGVAEPFLLEPEALSDAFIQTLSNVKGEDSKAARSSAETRIAQRSPKAPTTQASQSFSEPGKVTLPALTVRLYDGATPTQSIRAQAPAVPTRHAEKSLSPDEPEARALDDEIAFRQAPVFEEPTGPPMPLPANLLEFPRQLIAPRKVRPRYAEGPLRDEAGPADSQLRIFEVDAAHISNAPAAEDEAGAPQWTSLWLDTSTHGGRATDLDGPHDPHAGPAGDLQSLPRPHTAAVSRRLLAASIDAGLVVAGFLFFSAGFVLVSSHGHLPAATEILQALLPQAADEAAAHPWLHIVGPQLGLALAALLASFAFLYLVYQVLFFLLSDATPGMRHARIALCTFADDNPTRPAMRRRLLAVLVSAAPLGLGLLWALIDEDRLTWHDRLTRIYQRSY